MTYYPWPEGFPSGYYPNRNPMFAPLDRGIDAAVSPSQNILHTDILTWKWPPGKSKWSSVGIVNTNYVFDFFSHVYSGNSRVIVDCKNTVEEYTTTANTSFFTKGVHATVDCAFASVKDTLYFCTTNSAGAKRKRVGGAASTGSWGITGPTVAATVAQGTNAGTKTRIGWKYTYSWKRSGDSHVSSRAPSSLSTGPKQGGGVKEWDVTVQGAATTDGLDKIDIFRTTDGGSTFYYLKTINNTGAGAIVTQDSTPDSGLNKSIVAPSEDDNDPPPAIVTDICLHKDRLWVISVDNVQFSLHSIDGTKVNGIAEECFPPLYTFRFNAPIKLISNPAGLLVFTREKIHIITGQTFQDFDPDILYENIGIANRRAVATDGSVVYVFTNNKEILRIGDRVENIGDALSEADLLSFDPTTVRLTVHREGTNAALYVTNDNNVVLRFSFVTGTWSPPWQADGVVVSHGPIRSIQTATGEQSLLYAPRTSLNGYIWKEDYSTNLNDTEVQTSPIVAFGQIRLVDHGEMAALDAVCTDSLIQVPDVAFRFQETNGSYLTIGANGIVNEPPELTASTSVLSRTHYPDITAGPHVGTHLTLKLTFGDTPAGSGEFAELYGLGIKYHKTRSDR